MLKPLVFSALLAAFGATQAADLQCPAPVPNIGKCATVILTYATSTTGAAQPTGYLRRAGDGNPYSPAYGELNVKADELAWAHVKMCSAAPASKGIATVEFPCSHAGLPPVIDAGCNEPGATKCSKPKVV